MNGYIDLFILFVIYSFLGWVLETIYASVEGKKFVNRGFLKGCFCPIYGFGAILTVETFTIINEYIKNEVYFIITSILASIILVTLLEYVTGFILEKVFNCKWWDYSDNFANIKGYICLSYSILWGVLVYILIELVHPLILKLVHGVNEKTKMYLAFFLLCYFITDMIKSIIDALGLREVVLNYSKFSISTYRKKIKKYERFFRAFPKLMVLNIEVKNREIKYILNNKLDRMKNKLKDELDEFRND